MEIPRRRFVSFDRFATMVRALNGAGVPHTAEGSWFLEHRDWGPPRWVGMLTVLCDPDVVVRLLAAFDSIGYRPKFPVDPEIYADPDNLPDLDWDAEDDENDPDHIIFLEFVPARSDGPSFYVMVVWPETFEERYEGAFIDEVAPGVPVRVPESPLSRLRPLERLCPQIIRDVAVLNVSWREELVPAGHSVDIAALLDRSSTNASARPPIEAGVSFPRFRAIVRAMNEVRARYMFVGSWAIELDYETPLFWDGHLQIPLRLTEVRKTFAALAGIGYVPRFPLSPEAFLDPSRRIHWMDERQDAEDDRQRILTFIDPAPGLPRVHLVGATSQSFHDHIEAAEFDRMGPGLAVAVLNFDILFDSWRGHCPQWLDDVERLDRSLRARRGPAGAGAP